jgi:hypothetical protein
MLRLRARREREVELVADAESHNWQREGERHRRTQRRIQQLLAELGEPVLIAFGQDVLRPAGRTANNVLRANSEARLKARTRHSREQLLCRTRWSDDGATRVEILRTRAFAPTWPCKRSLNRGSGTRAGRLGHIRRRDCLVAQVKDSAGGWSNLRGCSESRWLVGCAMPRWG